ncbi:MAG: retropepsin-like domain-containing protein [Chloroflexi bacterium]|nr:retropepsin-like domain-containing protein [Chloroflexota bacterium]
MTVKGWFDPEERPYIQCFLLVPRFKKEAQVDFLFDTGSDVTTLSPRDGRKLGLDYARLRFNEPVSGCGSNQLDAVLEAVIGLPDENGNTPAFRLRLHVAPYAAGQEELPSIMGRDIIRRFEVVMNLRRRQLTCDVLTSDGDWSPVLGQ